MYSVIVLHVYTIADIPAYSVLAEGLVCHRDSL